VTRTAAVNRDLDELIPTYGGCAMIDRTKLLIGLLSNDHAGDKGGVTVFEVAAMLSELGEEHRAQAALATH
jgi:hypothetical protein